MGFYSMPGYFQTMPQVGKPLKARNEDNEQAILAIERKSTKPSPPPSRPARPMRR